MSSASGPSSLGPMDPVRYSELIQKKANEEAGETEMIIDPGSFQVPRESSPVALEILQESLNRRLSGGELLLLFEEAALHDLGSIAHQHRMLRSDPNIVTYVVDRNISYTNLCYADCGFCAFNRHQGDGDAYLLPQVEILEKCKTVVEAGGSQILLQGGHHPKMRLDHYEDMLKGIKEAYPQMWIHGFSPSEILHFGRLNQLSTREVLKKLIAAGLNSVPGGGAEILSDRVRKILAPGKAMTDEWIAVMEECHAVGLPTTVTMMFAHVETFAERVEHFLRARASQDKTGGYTAFIPWTFQPSNTPLMKIPRLKKIVESQGYLGATDYLRTLAIARIALDNFKNIQASWVTQGKAIGQLTLSYGANDLGSTMMEESVVSAAGTVHSLTQLDLDEMIQGAGFEAVQRDNGYNHLK